MDGNITQKKGFETLKGYKCLDCGEFNAENTGVCTYCADSEPKRSEVGDFSVVAKGERMIVVHDTTALEVVITIQ